VSALSVGESVIHFKIIGALKLAGRIRGIRPEEGERQSSAHAWARISKKSVSQLLYVGKRQNVSRPLGSHGISRILT